VRVGILGSSAIVVVLVLTGCGSTKGSPKTIIRTVTVTATTATGPGPPGEVVEFGYIRSLTRKGPAFRMRFDPAWFLSGETANIAAAQDGKVEPGEPVPNDNYVVQEGHRLLTYRVPADAHVTVLRKGVAGSPITVRQLSLLVNGKNPFGRPLFEPLTTGFWILVNIDTVRSLDQQYKP
jgi:hypothetical protein